MASGIEREIFEQGTMPEGTDAPSHLPDERTSEDRAVSDAIEGLRREPEPSQLRPPPQARPTPPQPGQQPGTEDGIEDRSNSGLLRALLDERERRQDSQRRLERFEQQENERRRQDGRPPLNERLFTDPDGTIAELRNEITEPLRQQIAQLQISHDFSLAEVRHGETFAHAWQAWYNAVGGGQDAATYWAIMNAGSPGEAMVQWYKRVQRDQEIGEDFDAFKRRIVDEALGRSPMAAAPNGAGEQPRGSNGQFAPRPQAPRIPTATSRLGSPGRGLPQADDDNDGSDAAIFAAGRPQSRRDR